ncbi:MAG: nickel insertion protein, partial [Myxococcota bacterium]
MSHTLFVDPVGGIAGDMVCAALIDVGADLSMIEAGLASLPVDGLRVSTAKVQRGVFAATHFLVECTEEQQHHRTWSSIR